MPLWAIVLSAGEGFDVGLLGGGMNALLAKC
jgi:hypothetical protein